MQRANQPPQRPSDEREELVLEEVVCSSEELLRNVLPGGPVHFVQFEQLPGLLVRPLLLAQVGVQFVVPPAS